MLCKLLLKKFLGSTAVLTALHALVYWIAWYQNGGFHNSTSGVSKAVANFGRAIGSGFGGSESGWVTVQNVLGCPLGAVEVSGHGAFVALMIVNSLLWGVVLGILVAFILKMAGGKD